MSERVSRIGMAMLTTCIAVPVSAQAQETDEGFFPEEIVVTARKREESLLDIPVSVTVLTAEDIERSTMQSMEDVAALTPGLTFNSFNAGNFAIPTIRGMAQTDITNIENNVATFLNGIYVPNKAGLDLSLLDLERIEVVKGPQSALYGRNSFAGSINYITRQAEPELSGRLTATLGSDERQVVNGTINTPLGESAALRLAASFDSFDGTIDNVADDEKLGGWERTSFAATLTTQATDALNVDAFLFFTDEENDHSPIADVPNNCAPGVQGFGFVIPVNASFCGDLPAFDAVDIDPRATGGDRRSVFGGISLDYVLPAGTLSALVAYSDAESRDNGDNDFTSGGTDYRVFDFQTFQIVDTINLATFTGNEFETEDTTVELRFRSNEEGPFSWMLGGFYARTDLSETLFQSVVGDASGLAPLTGPFLAPGVSIQDDPENTTPLTVSDYELESVAVFGELSYDFSDRFSTTFELRFTEEDREGNLPISVGAPGPGRVSDSFSFVTPRLIVSFAPNGADDRGLWYGSAARGVKSGGFNNTNSPIAGDAVYDEEENWTYEFGYKGAFANGRVQFSAAAYYVDWSDLQIRSFGEANVALIQNVSGAEVTGFEAQIQAAITERFAISAGYAYTDPSYDDDAIASSARRECGIPATICQRDDAGLAVIGGNQLERTSQHQINVTGEYNRELRNGAEGFVRLDVTHQSEQPNVINQNAIPERTLVNLRLGYDGDRYSVALWSRNLLDEDYARASVFFNVPDAFPVFSYKPLMGERRTYGITGGVRF